MLQPDEHHNVQINVPPQILFVPRIPAQYQVIVEENPAKYRRRRLIRNFCAALSIQ